jgi:hypothetical protein
MSKNQPTSTTKVEAKPAAESPMRKMVVRSVVGLLMLLFFGFMVNIDHFYFEVLIIVGQIVTWREVVSIRYNDIKEMKLRLFRTLNWYCDWSISDTSLIVIGIGFLLLFIFFMQNKFLFLQNQVPIFNLI